jgi:hypothetical protein
MELSGNYTYDSDYNTEIYTLTGLSAFLIIGIMVCLIYYFKTFTNIRSTWTISEVIVNILLSSGLMSGFLCIFYFTYLDKVEKDVLLNNIKNVFNDLGPEDKIPAEIVSLLQEIINYIKLNYVSNNNADANVIATNVAIRNKAIYIFGGGFCIVLIISIIIMLVVKAPIFKILGINLVLLASIAFTEFMFATFFVANYLYLDINNIIYDTLAVYQTGAPALTNEVNSAYPPPGYFSHPFFNN